jgi:hypothetical protein
MELAHPDFTAGHRRIGKAAALKALEQDRPITILVCQMCAEDHSQETNRAKHPEFIQSSGENHGGSNPTPGASEVIIKRLARTQVNQEAS